MRDLSHEHIQTKKSSHFTNFRVNLGLLTIVLALGLMYFFSVNSMATAGFQMKKLSAQLTELELAHKKLELRNSTLQSASAIQDNMVLANFVPATNITYIKDDSVALK